MSDSLDRLYAAVVAARDLDPATSRTARLLRSGQAKMSKKLAEEAIEVVIDAMNGEADAVVRESADLIYNLAVLWVSCGVKPRDVWAEMDRREKMLGIAEKLPKAQRKAVQSGAARSGTVDLRGAIALRARRASKRR
jgi:phosphoribosyl-ATP pyrophosphohydrolase